MCKHVSLGYNCVKISKRYISMYHIEQIVFRVAEEINLLGEKLGGISFAAIYLLGFRLSFSSKYFNVKIILLY